jgi:hypothetical protein
MAVTFLFVLLYFNSFLLIHEKSMVDILADEAVTAAVQELYSVAYNELSIYGTISDKQEYKDTIKAFVENFFLRYNRSAVVTQVNIANGYLTVEGYTIHNYYKNPDYISSEITPVDFRFKAFAVIKNVK